MIAPRRKNYCCHGALIFSIYKILDFKLIKNNHRPRRLLEKEKIKMIELTYHGQVKAKKNSKTIGHNSRTGKPFIRSDDAVKSQELLMAANFEDEYHRSEKYHDKIWRDIFQSAAGYKIEVKIWNQDRHRHDLDNQLSTIMDALTKAHIIRDDNQEVVRELSARYMGVDKSDPRAELKIIVIGEFYEADN